MPSNKTTKHPQKSISLTFYEEGHSYADDRGHTYQSATTFISFLFPEFETKMIAERIAKRDGISTDSLLAKWDKKRDEACRFGTRCHEIAEAVFNSEKMPHKPENGKERSAFSAFWKMADFIKKKYKVCGAEIIVFDPQMMIAGTVDLLVWDQSKNAFRLLDWKTNAKLEKENKFGQRAKPPLEKIHDCNVERYAMQLALYEILLKRNGYIDNAANVLPNLLWLNGDKVEVINIPDRKAEVLRALLEEAFLPF